MIDKTKNNELKCCKCNQPLFQKTENKLKLRTNILIFEKGNKDNFEDCEALIKCPICKSENKVPIVLNSKIKETELGHFIFETEKK